MSQNKAVCNLKLNFQKICIKPNTAHSHFNLYKSVIVFADDLQLWQILNELNILLLNLFIEIRIYE